MKIYYTSESVTEGHPDKVCDRISDAILDAHLAGDPDAHCACETMASTGLVVVTGEITSKATVDTARVVRDTIREIGYTHPEDGFAADTCAVMVALGEQSPDIAMGVNRAFDASDDPYSVIGAGDQGMMFGYATNETAEYLSLPIVLAHRLTRRLAEVRKDGILSYLRPDGKAQVTIEYVDGVANHVDTVVVSTQHSVSTDIKTLRANILEHVIKPAMQGEPFDEQTKIYINPTGRFVKGGPAGDTGLTGRKIIVDTYGGMAHHGGGAFSGKDPTKVDRSAAYAARHVAKNVVAAGLADRIEVGLSYAIGVAEPLSIYIETFGTEKIPVGRIEKLVRAHFDLRPRAIIDRLDLKRPIYKDVSSYGHFGRVDLDLPWEHTEYADELREEAGLA